MKPANPQKFKQVRLNHDIPEFLDKVESEAKRVLEVYGLPALRWTPDIEQRITDCVDELVRTLK